MADQPSLSDKDRADLIAYLDGELDEPAARDLEARLNRDPRIRAEADALRRTWNLLDYLPRPEPSTQFTHRTLNRVSALKTMPAQPIVRRRWRPWALGLGWAAAVLLAGIGAYAAVGLVPRSPPAARVKRPLGDDPRLVRDLGAVENMHRFEHVDDLRFIEKLDDPDLFGDDSGS
jgi:anti-sigma factor RsiW